MEAQVPARTRTKVATAVLAALTGVLAAGVADAQTESDESGEAVSGRGFIDTFDAAAVASVVDWQYQYADIGVVPFRVEGGFLESFANASSTGNASGIAGPMPVPLMANLGSQFPTNDPITGQPMPPQFKK